MKCQKIRKFISIVGLGMLMKYTLGVYDEDSGYVDLFD